MTLTPERQEFLSTIIITAVEGGINYWAYVDDYVPDTPAHAVIIDREAANDDPDVDRHSDLLTISKVEDAVRKITQAVVCGGDLPKYFPEYQAKALVIASMANDTCPDSPGAYDIDADFADNIAQVALFGKVVYG